MAHRAAENLHSRRNLLFAWCSGTNAADILRPCLSSPVHTIVRQEATAHVHLEVLARFKKRAVGRVVDRAGEIMRRVAAAEQPGELHDAWAAEGVECRNVVLVRPGKNDRQDE